MKTRSLWQVRYYPTATAYSQQIGHKGRLLPLDRARAIIRHLKASGVRAFRVRFQVAGRFAVQA